MNKASIIACLFFAALLSGCALFSSRAGLQNLPFDHDTFKEATEWGPYRPGTYFGLTDRRQETERIFGIAWADRKGKHFRHLCNVGELGAFHFTERSMVGQNYGRQEFRDDLTKAIRAYISVAFIDTDFQVAVRNDHVNASFSLWVYSSGVPHPPVVVDGNGRAGKTACAHGLHWQLRDIIKRTRLTTDAADGDKFCFTQIVIGKSSDATVQVGASRDFEAARIAAQAQLGMSLPGLSPLGKQAIADLLGSVGAFRGYLPVVGQGFRDSEDYLLSGVPSRSFFPRGFLWDEGFHLLATLRVQPALAVEVITHWLRLQDAATGWVPREIALGPEALARVPEAFREQSPAVANPPALMLPILALFHRGDDSTREFIRKEWLPHLQSWSAYLEREQASSRDGCLRWHGRTAAHCLASGLDDYPRGLLVNDDECHLDLLSWAFFMRRGIALIAGNPPPKVVFPAEVTGGATQESSGELADFIGNQPQAAGAVVVEPPWSSDGRCGPGRTCDPYSTAPCCSPSGWCGGSDEHCFCQGCSRARPLEESAAWKGRIGGPHRSPHFGYVSLFPVLLGLEADEGRLERLLPRVREELLTPHGLASLSRRDPLYRKGEDYWRGKVWGNIQALAEGAFRGYAARFPRLQEPLLALAREVREGWLAALQRSLRDQGFLFENYDPQTGRGTGAAPFTGWTAASAVLMEAADGWWAQAVGAVPAASDASEAEL